MELHSGPKSTADERGLVYLMGGIDAKKAEETIKRIIELNLKGVDSIQLVINSHGGCVRSGFAIVDTILWSRAPVRTIGLGMVASMALLILMAGEKGKRIITPRVSLLSHRHSGWNFGSHAELLAARREDDLVHQQVLDHYATFTKIKSRHRVEKLLLRETDVWLKPQEAVRYGIVDEIQGRFSEDRGK